MFDIMQHTSKLSQNWYIDVCYSSIASEYGSLQHNIAYIEVMYNDKLEFISGMEFNSSEIW